MCVRARTGVQALGDGGGVDQVALAQAACDVGVDVTQVDLPRQHVGVLRRTVFNKKLY